MIYQWIAAFLLFIQGTVGHSCKCLYGDSCWPSKAEFSTLQTRLSQPIIYPTPPEAACYPASSPSGNCSDVTSNYDNGRWRSDQPGSSQNTNFEAYIYPNGTISACYLNATLRFPCEQGAVPPVGVDAHTVQDVQATVKFAVNNNLRLVIKNTG